MNDFVLSLLMATPQGGEGASGGAGGIMTFLPFVAIIAIFYFLIIRPQNKKQKDTQKMLAALKKGDEVVTIGGIHGTIVSAKEQTVVLKVDGDVKLKFNRSAISSVVTVAKDDKDTDDDDDADDSEKK